MSVYKDEERNTWYVSVPYKDYLGKRKQKFKRGFKTKGEAKAWERLFIDKMSDQPTMIFNNFLDVYLDFCKKEIRASTYQGRKYRIEKYIRSFFSNKRLNEITSLDIKHWQHFILDRRTKEGNEFSNTYKDTLNKDLIAIFNHAKRYYNLHKSPCDNVKRIGNKRAREKRFLTLAEFKEFIKIIENEEEQLIYIMLFYTGLRIGELLALTYGDIDIKNRTLRVNKSLNRVESTDYITEPKTLSSNRTVILSDNVIEKLEYYKSKVYGAEKKDRIFFIRYDNLTYRLRERIKKHEELKGLTVHSFRHSHTALLIELGYNPLLIAERLGHTDIKMTLNTYAHLYPNKQIELAKELGKL